MGLLDFMGSDFEDPKTMATLQLAAGLLGGKGSGMQRLSQGLLGYGQTMGAAKKAAQEEAERKQIAEMRQMQLQQMQAQAEQARLEQARARQVEDAYRGALRTPEQLAMAQHGGPTKAAAAAAPDLMPQLDQAALMRGLVQADPLAAAKMLNQPPEYKVVGNSLVEVGRGGVKEAYRAPDKPVQTDLAKLIAEMQALPPGHPMRGVYENAIRKATTHQPGVSVSYGAPVAGVDKDGKPVFFQPDRAGGAPAIIPGVAPPPKETPAALREKLAQNQVTLGKIETAIDLVSKKPGALGAQNYLGDTIMQRLDPSGTDVRAMIADIAGQKIHDRSGAAVTVGEAARLKPYIPNTTDTPETVKKKLDLFRREYAAMQQAINSGASVDDASAPQNARVRRFNFQTGELE